MPGVTKLAKGAVLALVVLALAGYGYARWSGGDYTVKLVSRSAAQLVNGSPVRINGFIAGNVTDLAVRDGKAQITVALYESHAPLHAGTTGRIEWNSALGERELTLRPGPGKNPEIPEGSIVPVDLTQVEVGEILAALNGPTRARLASLIQGLNKTVNGSERDIQATLTSAGSTVNALGELLEAVGRDGPAVRSLVEQLSDMVAEAAQRQGDVQNVVRNLTAFTGDVASRQRELTDSLRELPPTLRTAEQTLGKVQATSGPARELLNDLRPATARLPETARNLAPVLREVRPAVAELRPMLGSAQELLGHTPGLLDTAHATMPQGAQSLRNYRQAVSFLRPYTPELVGWLTNWGQNFAPYDSQGHLWSAVLGNVGPLANNESLVMPPGIHKSSRPAPGEAVGQPWHAEDASGSPIR